MPSEILLTSLIAQDVHKQVSIKKVTKQAKLRTQGKQQQLAIAFKVKHNSSLYMQYKNKQSKNYTFQ